MRPKNIEDIMLRSAIWEHSIHHWKKPGYSHPTKPVAPEEPVMNKDCEPVNASRAAHDRMELCAHVMKLEKDIVKANELYKKALDELHRLERAF